MRHTRVSGFGRVCSLQSGLLALGSIVAISAASAVFDRASATPYVDVKATWAIAVDAEAPPLPTGISVSCFGGAASAGTGCSDSRTLDAPVTQSEQLSVDVSSGFVLTNTTTQTFDTTAVFTTDFSAFNPGGPQVGISIDDPSTEAASFTSSVSGQGVGDSHGCAVGFLGDSGPSADIFSATECGVPSPDASQELLYINLSNLAPGQSEDIPYTIAITATFDIAEPTSLAILAIGLFGVAIIGRRVVFARI